MGLLDGGIKKIVGNALTGIFLDFTIIQKSYTTPTNPWESGTESETETACKAIVTKFKYYEIDGEKVRAEDRKIIILAQDLAVIPKDGDYIKANTDSRRYLVIGDVKKDPAGATYIVQGR